MEDQDRRENHDHDGDDKLDDEMKQSDANFSDQSNNFSVWRYQNVECQNLLRFLTDISLLMRFYKSLCSGKKNVKEQFESRM